MSVATTELLRAAYENVMTLGGALVTSGEARIGKKKRTLITTRWLSTFKHFKKTKQKKQTPAYPVFRAFGILLKRAFFPAFFLPAGCCHVIIIYNPGSERFKKKEKQNRKQASSTNACFTEIPVVYQIR